MDPAQDGYRNPHLRASDADRDAVVTALGEHFQAGRLTSEELDDRMGRALSAKTLGELATLTTDLPEVATAPQAMPAPVPGPPLSRYRRRYPVAGTVVFAVAVAAVAGLIVAGWSHHSTHGFLIILVVGLIVARRLGLGRGRRGPGSWRR